ncbi:hypothetical protein [Nocardioides pakistanensis]
MAGFVALSINETVASRRRAELETKVREQREASYRAILDHMLQSFQGGPLRSEWEVRTQIALWGSPTLLSAYSDWRRIVNELTREGSNVAIAPEMKLPLQESLARVCLEARRDLAISDVAEPTVAEIAEIFFDDYQRTQ